MIFQAAFDTEIEVQSPTGVDGSGKPVWGDPKKIKARVEDKPDLTYGTDGVEKSYQKVVYTSTKIDMESRITIPDQGIDGQRPVRVDFSKGIGVSTALCKVYL